MSVNVIESPQSSLIEVHLSGKLQKEDYEHFTPIVEKKIAESGKLRLLVVLKDFHGWSVGALWEDMKFDMKHFRDIERLAIVGESQWEAGMVGFCKPFTSASIKYFDHSEEDQARTWIQE